MAGQINIWTIILEADLVVKAVLLILVAASVYSWAIVLKKKKLFEEIQRDNSKFLEIYTTRSNLGDVLRETRPLPFSPYAIMFARGYEELLRIKEKLGDSGSKEHLKSYFATFGFGVIERALGSGANECNEKLESWLSTLATIGSICPFVGLFGTVWGIINSFRGLAGAEASLDSVAPGIAEALVATAIGLAAAIPAVLFFNYYSNLNAKMNMKMESFGKDFLNFIERLLISKE